MLLYNFTDLGLLERFVLFPLDDARIQAGGFIQQDKKKFNGLVEVSGVEGRQFLGSC